MKNIIGIMLLIASAAIFWWYIDPVLWGETGEMELAKKSVKELRIDREHYLEALQKTREIEEARTGLLEKYNAIPLAERERLLKFLPDHIDSVRLIIDINGSAAAHGLALQNLDVGSAPKGGATLSGNGAGASFGPTEETVGAMSLRFSIRGSYSGLRVFLQDLEESLRLVDASTVIFEATGDPEYDFDVTIDTYRLL